MKPSVTQERIEDAYRTLGYRDGWRFMSCPQANFANPSTLLITLNPGGGAGQDVANPTWSQERGSAYLHEAWGDRPVGQESLQIQVQKLFEMIDQPIDKAGSAYFIPFRSARWANLENRDKAVAFARSLWVDFSQGMKPKYVICMGNIVGKYMKDLFGAERLEKRPTGWGNISLSMGETASGGRFVILPHLGTFKLFSNKNCIPSLRTAFGIEGIHHA
ncbi:MAG: hypothetical protein ABI395_08360 [Sphingobium sp.]